MVTSIIVYQDGTYFSWKLDFSEQMVDGEREQGCWVDRIDYLESDNWFTRNIWHKLFRPVEFHAIIAKGNRIYDILGEW